MAIGPVEYAVIAFPGNRFNGDVVPALSELVENGTVHIIDLVFIHKDQDGTLTIGELEELDAELGAVFAELEGEIDDLLNEEDLQGISTLLPPNSSAAVIVWENLWAERFADSGIHFHSLHPGWAATPEKSNNGTNNAANCLTD